MDPESYMMLSFFIPAGIIILLNIIIFLTAMRIAQLSLNKKSSMTEKNKMVTWIKGSSSLLCILGLNWIFGFFYFRHGLEWLAVIFTVLTSLQGVCIAIHHIILNDKAFQALRKHCKTIRTYNKVRGALITYRT